MERFKEIRIENILGRGNVYAISLLDDFDFNQAFYTTYTPTETERLDNIAYKFYKDASKWFVIARANKAVTGKLYAERGVPIIIPNID